MDLSGQLIRGTGSYEVKELSAQDAVLKHLDKGTKYLECTSAGTVADVSDLAYGDWESSWYKPDTSFSVIMFINDKIGLPGATENYNLVFSSDESVKLRRGTTVLFSTVVSYIDTNTWYKLKWTRTKDGEFTVYIMGGDFGTDDWTLIDVSGGSGTNPVTDNTYTESNYYVYDFDVGDRIAIDITHKAVQQ